MVMSYLSCQPGWLVSWNAVVRPPIPPPRIATFLGVVAWVMWFVRGFCPAPAKVVVRDKLAGTTFDRLNGAPVEWPERRRQWESVAAPQVATQRLHRSRSLIWHTRLPAPRRA